MKKALVSMAFAALLFACNGKKTDDHGHDHTDGTHQHENGEAHADQPEEVKQEEFTVTQDSVVKIQEHDHSHGEDGHQH